MTATRSGTTQYVILGAGMDTFAFRHSDVVERLSVFEADHPLTQEEKWRQISRAGWEIPETLHFVQVDFTKDNLADRLLKSSYKKEEKTFFSWLASAII